MPSTKFGVGDNVSTDSGFAPYEGQVPKSNKIYPVELVSCAMRETGPKSQTPGTEYINSLWKITDGECAGFTTYHRIVPGDSEFQQIRVAQFMQAVCGKNSAPVVYEKVEDGGKISKIGGKKPVGVKCGMSFQTKQDKQGPEGAMVTEANDLFPGWKPKGKKELEEDDEPVEEPEDDVEEEELEDDSEEPDSDEDDEDPEEEEEDGDEDEDGPVEYSVASAMSLAELKALAKESEYKDSELAKFKGPKGKKGLLALLIEDEVVASEDSSDKGFSDEPPF